MAPVPADALRAVAVGVINLSGLGLGYALLRRWFAMAACLIATGVLLFAALPADPDGVAGGVVIGYLVVLGLAAVHGAFRGLRTRPAWPPRSSVALVLGLVLLAAPVGGFVAYDGARDDATQQMLLDRLEVADLLVTAAKAKPFDTVQGDFRTALASYRDLHDRHAGSEAAKLVPDRLQTYYAVVAEQYGRKQYCEAIAPLRYLRTVPEHFGTQGLGALATWPDDRLATSLYECGSDQFAEEDGASSNDGNLSELLSTFPRSAQAAKVEPVVRATIDKAAAQLRGSEPCPAVERLDTLGSRALALPGEKAGVAAALKNDASRAQRYVQSGTYTCGVDEYKDGDFEEALDTLNDFITTYPHDKNRALAKKIAIAAEIAQEVPDAGKHLPSPATGGSIPITFSNDSPDKIEVLFTGPVTGSFTLRACGSCREYSSDKLGRSDSCQDSGRNYPKKTVYLPAGTTYFLHKSPGGATDTPGTDTVKLRDGYIYTECAYTVTSSFGL
jgi:hypothetical protein